MLLQIAFDKPEHLALLSRVAPYADIIEIGTPVLKRLGLSAITTARELCPGRLIMADTKTVDGGQLEARMVFTAGASFMTVLSCASRATHEAVHTVAAEFGASVIVDTITESGKPVLIPLEMTFPATSAYVAVHAPSDARLAGDTSTGHIAAVERMHERGFMVSLAGGIGPQTIDAVLEAEPEIVVVGSAITEANNPEEIANWIKNKLSNPNHGWPWDKK